MNDDTDPAPLDEAQARQYAREAILGSTDQIDIGWVRDEYDAILEEDGLDPDERDRAMSIIFDLARTANLFVYWSPDEVHELISNAVERPYEIIPRGTVNGTPETILSWRARAVMAALDMTSIDLA